MTDKKFNVILAINTIAREVKSYYHDHSDFNGDLVIRNLTEIEEYLTDKTGYLSNQPTAREIVESEMDI